MGSTVGSGRRAAGRGTGEVGSHGPTLHSLAPGPDRLKGLITEQAR